MKPFTKEFMISNRGCFEEQRVLDLYFSKGNNVISAQDIIDSDIRTKDKFWFFCKKVFTKEQNQQIAIEVAEIVLPIYEERYPENKAPREAIEAAKLYIAGHLSLDDLLIKRRAAYATAYATDAAYATATAAAAAAYAATAAAAAAADADAAAADAAYATAAAAAAAAYNRKLIDVLIKHLN